MTITAALLFMFIVFVSIAAVVFGIVYSFTAVSAFMDGWNARREDFALEDEADWELLNIELPQHPKGIFTSWAFDAGYKACV